MKKNIPRFIIPVLLSMVGGYIGIYSKHLNLLQYSVTMPKHYPLWLWLHAAGIGALVLWIYHLAEEKIFSSAFAENKNAELKLFNSLTYLILLLPVLGFSLRLSLFLCLVFKSLLIVIFRKSIKPFPSSFKTSLLAFFIITLGQAVFNPFVSPLGWDNPLTRIKKDESTYIGPATSAQLIQYSHAKRFDFSGFDSSYWGSMPFGVTSGRSLLTPFLVNLFDLSVIDTETQVRLWLQIAYFWCVLGSFGFYLYLNLALGLSPIVSLLGGLCFVISNAFLAEQFTYHFPLFIGPFLTLPFALLFSRIALNKSSWKIGLFSGIFYSLHHYIYQSHPDVIIHSFLFWLSYLCFHLVLIKEGTRRSHLRILLAVCSGYAAGSLFAFSPIIEALIKHEMHVLGHAQNIYVFYGIELGRQIVLNPMSWLYPLFALVIASIFSQARKKKLPLDFLFYCAVLSLLIFIFCLGNDGPFFIFLSKLKMRTLNFRQPPRVLMYLSLSLLVIICYGLDWYLNSSNKKLTKWKSLLPLSGLILFIFFCVKKFNLFQEFIPGTILILLCFIFFIHKTQKKYEAFKITGVFSLVLLLLYQYASLDWQGESRDLNPKQCRPYVTLESLLTKTTLFPEDLQKSKATLRNKILKFREDFIKESKTSVFPEKSHSYPLSLKLFEDETAFTQSLNSPLSLTASVSPEIDKFYLNDFSCIHPLDRLPIHSTAKYSEIHYNLMGLFNGLDITSDFISKASPELNLAGICQGLLSQSSNQCTDPQILKVFAPLNALYLIPGEYYLKMGGYRLIPRWQNDGIEIFENKLTRKMYNLGGNQLFVISEKELDKLKLIPALEILPIRMSEATRVPYRLVRDLMSYPTAYLASKTEFISPLHNQFEKYHFPLNDENLIKQYKKEVDYAHEKLLSLSGKNAILLEDANRTGIIESEASNNYIKILNIFGSKAAFEVNCEKAPCQLVFNRSALNGWKAYVNGEKLTIRKANFAFLSVEVPLGRSLVWFEYIPYLMVFSCLVSLVAFATALFLIRRMKNF